MFIFENEDNVIPKRAVYTPGNLDTCILVII